MYSSQPQFAMQSDTSSSPEPYSGDGNRFPGGRPAATTLIHIWPASALGEEDTDLTAYLASAWRKLHATSRRPPRCPRCHSGGATNNGADYKGLPQFVCDQCHRRFNRLSGTPMARLRPDEGTLHAFFGLASQHMSVAEASRRLGINAETVVRWSVQSRLWLLELDPSGSWEQHVHLAVHYAVIPEDQQGNAPAGGLGCRCSPVRSAANDMPALLRVCPLCEQGRHPSQLSTG
jgi:transposase-like protein